MNNQVAPVAPTPRNVPSSARQKLSGINWQESLGLLAVYGVLVVALSRLCPFFLHVDNFLNILVAVSVIAILSVTMTLVIISGGIDLSVGSVVTLTSVTAAQLSYHMPLWSAALIALGVGTLIGYLNGLAITKIGINPLISTLGSLSIAHGAALLLSGGLTQSINSKALGSEAFSSLGQGRVMDIPSQVIVMALLFILAAWVMKSTVFGRSIYAIGGNPNASRLAGLPVSRLQTTVYVLSGLCAALGGIFSASQMGAGSNSAGTGIELSVIAAVILGGTSLSGGKGTIAGTLLGVLILGTLNNGLTLLSVSSDYQEVARGAVLLLAVGLDQLRLRVASRD